MQHADVALELHRFSFQPLQFFGVLRLLQLQLRYLSVAKAK